MPPDDGPPRGGDILVVDDDPGNLELMAVLLRSQGYKVRTASRGERALEEVREKAPDIVLLDVDMPEMNGYEVCEELKADPRLRSIPVIFVSALDTTAVKAWGFGVGGVDYVTKPFQFDELQARLRTHLELARLRRELAQQNVRLEEAVAERTRELAEARARLGILNRAKADFLRLISHEVRTPLCGVFGAADLLLEALAGDPRAADCRALYEQSRRRLMSLVEDALLLTEISAGLESGTRQPCLLEPLLEDARTRAASLAESRAVVLTPLLTGSLKVQGVAGFLARALQSLLETAVKFARAGSSVRMSHSTAPGEVCIIVEADGQAIPPGVLMRFFDLLVVPDPGMADMDLGLGPAVAERIVTLHGGSVSVENLEPPGLRLTVRLRAPAPSST